MGVGMGWVAEIGHGGAEGAADACSFQRADRRGQRGEHAEGESAVRRGVGESAFDKGEHLFLQEFTLAREALLGGVLGNIQGDGDVFD